MLLKFRLTVCFAAKLARIKALSSQLTVKKVAITSDQLNRRYNLIYSSISSGPDRFDLLKASRWYSKQEVLVRSSLENAEPFPWLKHLDKQQKNGHESENVLRMPWHLSALIMEEYLHAQNAQNHSIPEHPSRDFITSLQDKGSSRSFSLSRSLSTEGLVSFEPLLESPLMRSSNESRRSIDIDSTFSSILSTGSQTSKDWDRSGFARSGLSPASNRRLGIRRKWGSGSEDGSSARNSLAEQSDSDRRDSNKQALWQLGGERRIGIEESSGDDSFEQNLITARPTATAVPTMKASPTQVQVAQRIINRNIYAITVPLSSEDQIALALEQQRKGESDADMEYNLKSQYVFFSFFLPLLGLAFYTSPSGSSLNVKILMPTSVLCSIISPSTSGNTRCANQVSCPTRSDSHTITKVVYHRIYSMRLAMTPRT